MFEWVDNLLLEAILAILGIDAVVDQLQPDIAERGGDPKSLLCRLLAL